MNAYQAHKAQVDTLIRKAIAATVPPERIGHVDITEREDSTGDEAIFVDVSLVNSTGGFGASIHFRVSVAVREALSDIGEKRYPYVMFDYVAAAA